MKLSDELHSVRPHAVPNFVTRELTEWSCPRLPMALIDG